MNQHQGSFNTFRAQPSGGPYAYGNTYNLANHFPGSNPDLSNGPQPLTGAPSQQATQFSYAATVSGPFHQPVPPPQFFQSLPQGNGGSPAQRPPQQSSRQAISARNALPSLPASPGNGPGAPPPERNSPEIEDELMNALRREPADDEAEYSRQDHDDDGEDPNDPVFHLPAPPPAIYPSPEDLDKAIHAWSLEHGYELVRRASKKNARGVLYKRFYNCSKHGRISNTRGLDQDRERQRVNRRSNRMGCPMSLSAVACDPSDPSGSWEIKVRKAHHNHPAQDALKMPGHRRRARMGGIEVAVDGLFDIDTKIPDVLKFLQRTHPDGLFTRTDVANMKLKYKKYGTCANRDGTGERVPTATWNKVGGTPPTCHHCRTKKTKCDGKRPTCGACLRDNTPCAYDHETTVVAPESRPTTQPTRPRPAQTDSPEVMSDAPFRAFPAASGAAGPQPAPDVVPQTTTSDLELRALLARFQAEHIKPARLSLESSEVEYLATATCGNGTSYASVPSPFTGRDWAEYENYREAFLEAARKENTYDVLVGAKRQPLEPTPQPVPGKLDEYQPVDVKIWNEYMKQLAIYLRRNASLVGAMHSTLSPALRSRLKGMTSAREMWKAVEDTCRPRGSEQAYRRFVEINGITLANSSSLDDYIHRLQSKSEALNHLEHDALPARSQLDRNGSAVSKPVTDGAVSDAALCFQFLMGLGEEHKRLIDSVCKKNNIGGFGSGERLGFRDLTRLVRQLID